jgi:hypothetical protein
MIIRLSTIQAADHWEAIKDMLDRAVPDLPGQSLDTVNNILKSLVMGESVCWVAYRRVAERQNDIIAMMITRIIYDDVTEVRSLLIYCLAGWEMIDLNFYREGFESLKKYGKENNCNRIIFYADESRMIRVAEDLNFNVDLRFGVYQL